jgi:hypothetical protein
MAVRGAWVDRRREGWEDESDAAFLERVDVLVMAEWDQRRRASNLRQLLADYSVRTEFLSVLQDLMTVRDATGGITPLPSRRDMELLLTAVRQARGEERREEREGAPADGLDEEWDTTADITAGTTPSTCP